MERLEKINYQMKSIDLRISPKELSSTKQKEEKKVTKKVFETSPKQIQSKHRLITSKTLQSLQKLKKNRDDALYKPITRTSVIALVDSKVKKTTRKTVAVAPKTGQL